MFIATIWMMRCSAGCSLTPLLPGLPLQWCTADFGGVRTPNATALMLVGGLPGLYCRSSRLAHLALLLDAARGFRPARSSHATAADAAGCSANHSRRLPVCRWAAGTFATPSLTPLSHPFARAATSAGSRRR